MSLKKCKILSVDVTTSTYEEILRVIQSWIEKKQSAYICVAATHLVMECQTDETLRKGVNNADIVTTDGMPLVWVAKLYGYAARRVYGPTLTQRICTMAEKEKVRVFFLGGSLGQSARLKKKLLEKYPKLQLAGFHETPTRPLSKAENKKVLKKIITSKAQIVFVGLGCPLQEKWMIEHRQQLPGKILIGVGAAFNFISGDVTQAPLFIQNAGFEWLFRLIQEPRLLKRYFKNNVLFTISITRQLISDFFKIK